MENKIIEGIEEQTVEQVCGGVSNLGLGKFAAGVGVGVLGVLAIKKAVTYFSEKKQRKIEEAEYAVINSKDVEDNE